MLTIPVSLSAGAEESLDELDFALEEVVVTAQRREESISDVPLSVTAIDSEAMAVAQLDNISNIAVVSPSVQFNSTNIASSSGNIIMRGLGTVGNSRTFEGGVGVFIDGVYRTRAGAALESFLDMEGMQILRGPQGTLFGKNTSAGAVLISSAEPSLEGESGRYKFQMGNYGNRTIKGSYNQPLNEKSAIRIAAIYDEDDGYFEDVNLGLDTNGKDTKAVKAQLLVTPTDNVSFRFIADYLESSGLCCYGTSDYLDGAVTTLTDSLALAGGNRLPSADNEDFETAMNSRNRQDVTDKGLVWKIDYELKGGSLNSITAYREYEVKQTEVDADFHPVDLLQLDESFKSEFFSQEFTFHGEFEPWQADYIVGLFLSYEDIDMDRNLYWGQDAQAYYDASLGAALSLPPGTVSAPAGLWSHEIMEATAESRAIFVHSDFTLTEQWNMVVGLRYSEEEKEGEFGRDFFDLQLSAFVDPICASLGLASPCVAPANPFTFIGIQPGPAYKDDMVDRAFSGTWALQYRPNEHAMWYFSYNHGFKAGGVTVDANAAGQVANNPDFGGTPLDPAYDPEKVDAYELGLKATYWQGRARSNVALFYNDIEDLQVAQFVGLRFTILNADSAKNYGVEIENLVQMTETLSANLDVIWMPYAKYGEDDTISDALSDQRMRWAPHVAANTAISMDVPLSDDLSLTGQLQYIYKSSRFASTSIEGIKLGHLDIFNLNLGLRSASMGWVIELWAQNLADKTYSTTVFNSPGQAGDLNTYLGAPRTYGLTIRGEF
ncbi:TonB-dependent receptor [Maricurvus nonylphenolicus]